MTFFPKNTETNKEESQPIEVIKDFKVTKDSKIYYIDIYFQPSSPFVPLSSYYIYILYKCEFSYGSVGKQRESVCYVPSYEKIDHEEKIKAMIHSYENEEQTKEIHPLTRLLKWDGKM